jgi:hypothetical protein
LFLPALLQLLQGVLPDRLQHPVARPVGTGFHHHQRLLYQGSEGPENLPGPEVIRRPDGLRSFQGEASGEDGKPSEQGFFSFGEEVVAPVERGLHGALALGQVPGPAGRERLVQTRD